MSIFLIIALFAGGSTIPLRCALRNMNPSMGLLLWVCVISCTRLLLIWKVLLIYGVNPLALWLTDPRVFPFISGALLLHDSPDDSSWRSHSHNKYEFTDTASPPTLSRCHWGLEAIDSLP